MPQRHIALALCSLGLALVACDRPTPLEVNSPSILANQNARDGAAMGFTDGWENGKTVLY